MTATLDRRSFRDQFKRRAVVIPRLPASAVRDLALRVNELDGYGDASLRTRAEHDALFDLLHDELDAVRAPDVLTVADDDGRSTAVGEAVGAYDAAAVDADDAFAVPLWMMHITGWPGQLDELLERPVPAPQGARVACWPTDPADSRHIPLEPDGGPLFASPVFSLENTGNRTLRAPKRSWRIQLEHGDDDDPFVGLERLNLKAMYNDPSQMREALAWRLFERIGVVAPRHTYAKFAVGYRHLGLFSLIEDVDKRGRGGRTLICWTGRATRRRTTASTGTGPAGRVFRWSRTCCATPISSSTTLTTSST